MAKFDNEMGNLNIHTKTEKFGVLLVNLADPAPCFFAGSDYTLENSGLGYIAAFLRRAGHSVEIIDTGISKLSNNQLISKITETSPDLIGFSPTIATINNMLEITRYVKECTPDVHITIGGHHATCASKEILENETSIDSVVKGEGELTILELVERLQGRQSLHGVRGLIFRDTDGKIHENLPRPKITNLDSLPFPARDALKIQIENGGSRTARVITSRGCVANCAFCSTPAFENCQGSRCWRWRSPDSVLDELTELKSYFDIKVVLFSDDNFIGPGKFGIERAVKIAEGIITRDLNITFRILCRVEPLILGGMKLVLTLKKAGLERAVVGLESGCDDALRIMKKSASVRENLESVQVLTKSNVFLHAGFIMFHPYTLFPELLKNSEFLEKVNQAAFFQHISSKLELYPGAGIIQRLDKDGLLHEGVLSYKSSQRYRFLEPHVGLLANALYSMRPQMAGLDRVLIDTDILLTNYTPYMRQKYESYLNQYLHLRRDISGLNMAFFRDMVNMASQGWNDAYFDSAANQYIDKTNATRYRIIKLNCILQDIRDNNAHR